MVSSSAADLQTIIFSRAKQLEHVFRNRFRRRHAVHLHEHASPAVIIDQGARLALVGRQALGNHLFAIVGALHQLAAIMVTAAGHLGRMIVNIVNLPAHSRRYGVRSAAASTDSVDHEVDDQRLHLAAPRRISSSLCACGSVRGKPSSTNPSAQSGARNALLDHAQNQVVGHQFAAFHDGLGAQPERRAAADVLAKHVAGGNVRARHIPGRSAWPACPCPRQEVPEKLPRVPALGGRSRRPRRLRHIAGSAACLS